MTEIPLIVATGESAGGARSHPDQIAIFVATRNVERFERLLLGETDAEYRLNLAVLLNEAREALGTLRHPAPDAGS
jgi:hypothetical protein